MKMSAADIANVADFLNLLTDVPDTEFRDLIIRATVLDTTALQE